MKTVYIGMTADIMHPGLINIISIGAQYGDVIIGLLTDEAILAYKRLPYLNYDQRKSIAENIKGVKQVVPQVEWSYVPNLLKYKPDYMIHGDDWKQNWYQKLRSDSFKVMKQIGGEVIEVPYTKGFSSSEFIEHSYSRGTTSSMRLSMLKRLIKAKPIVRVLEAHNGLIGLIIEKIKVKKTSKVLEFDAMWSSSLADSTSIGKPDIEAVDITTRMYNIKNILECTTKPIIYDGDTGGKIEHFELTIKTLERNGISAVIIEDKVGLKKNSLFGTAVPQKQDTIEGFCNKIKAGKRAQITQDFMIISRIESFILGKTIEDALERAEAYIESGTDGIMIHSKERSGEDIKAFCKRFRQQNTFTPLIVVPTTFNHIREDEFIELGVNVVIYANHMLRASYLAMSNVAEQILQQGRSLEASANCTPIKDILELIPGTK